MAENSEENKTESKPKSKGIPAYEKNRVSAVKHDWTEARCKKAASRFDSVDAWQKGAPSSYKAAFAHGWVEACSNNMTGKVVGIGKGKKKGSKPSYKQAG